MFTTLQKCLPILFFLAILQWQSYAQETKIMIVGEVVARGNTSSDFGSFRRPLHIMLTGNGYNVDFVGSQTLGKVNDFDRNHEARVGLYIGGDPDTSKNYNALGNMYRWLRDRKPQIVLIYLGTHDILVHDSASIMAEEMDALLNEIDEYERDYLTPVKVLVANLVNTASILPGDSLSQIYTEFNRLLKGIIDRRRDRTPLPDDVRLVDMEKGAGIDYRVDNRAPFDDGDIYNYYSPNDNGFDKMAKVWFDALKGTLMPQESPLHLLSPEDKVMGLPLPVTFSWDTISGVAEYWLQVAEDSLFKNRVYENDSIQTSSQEVSGLGISKTYYWRVINSNRYYSKIRTFSTAMQSPANLTATTFSLNKVLLTWTDNSPDELGFIVERKTGGSDFQILDTAAANATLYIDSSLILETNNYTYRIKSYKSNTFSPYSNEATVLATSVTVENSLPKEFKLEQNYPNPFNPVTTIKYQLPDAGFVRLTIYDILGNEIRTLINGEKPAGYYSVVLNASDLSSGVYFYELTVSNTQSKTGRYTNIRKFILMK